MIVQTIIFNLFSSLNPIQFDSWKLYNKELKAFHGCTGSNPRQSLIISYLIIFSQLFQLQFTRDDHFVTCDHPMVEVIYRFSQA